MSKSKLWTKNFLLITLVNFFLYFAFQLFPSALPPYLKNLGASDQLLGWLQGILTIAVLIVRPLAGMALDRYGRRGFFIAGLIGMVLVTAAYRFFPVVSIILVIRFLHGAVWGLSSTACTTVASDNIQKERFAEGMGYFSLATSIGMAVAPVIALSLTMNHNVYLALIFLAASCLLALLIQYPKPQAPVQTEKKKPAPYARESILPSVLILFIMATWGAVITFIALYGAEKSISNVGLFFTVYAVSMLLTRPFLGRLVDRRGFGVGIWLGVALVPIALLLLAFSNGLPPFLLCAVIYGIGVGAAQSSLQAMAIISVPKDRMGAANATFFTGLDAGIGAGAIVAGLISPFVGYGAMFAVMAAFPLVAGGIYAISKKRNKADAAS